jgi:hypothetical protein
MLTRPGKGRINGQGHGHWRDKYTDKETDRDLDTDTERDGDTNTNMDKDPAEIYADGSETSVADPDPHDFGLLDPHPDSAFQMRIPDADADPG